jgi:hypothetical protein
VFFFLQIFGPVMLNLDFIYYIWATVSFHYCFFHWFSCHFFMTPVVHATGPLHLLFPLKNPVTPFNLSFIIPWLPLESTLHLAEMVSSNYNILHSFINVYLQCIFLFLIYMACELWEQEVCSIQTWLSVHDWVLPSNLIK